MMNEDIDVIRKLGMLDTLILIWDKWNRKEVTAEQALYEMYQYIRSDISGAKKRRELMKTSVPIGKEKPK